MTTFDHKLLREWGYVVQRIEPGVWRVAGYGLDTHVREDDDADLIKGIMSEDEHRDRELATRDSRYAEALAAVTGAGLKVTRKGSELTIKDGRKVVARVDDDSLYRELDRLVPKDEG